MAKILRRRGPGLKTLGLQAPVSKFSDAAQRFVTGKTPVRRLQVHDPARALTDERIAKNITNNPNLKYQPTGLTNNNKPRQLGVSLPGATKKRVSAPPKTQRTNRGKVIARKAGKVLRYKI